MPNPLETHLDQQKKLMMTHILFLDQQTKKTIKESMAQAKRFLNLMGVCLELSAHLNGSVFTIRETEDGTCWPRPLVCNYS